MFNVRRNGQYFAELFKVRRFKPVMFDIQANEIPSFIGKAPA